MIELAATHFAARSRKSITVANRTLERGSQLAARFGAEAITLNEMPERLHEFDIIVTVHGEHAADHRQGTARARRQAAPARADVHRRPRACRATSSRRPRSSTTCSCTASTILPSIVKDNLQIRQEAVVQAEADDRRRRPAHFLRWLEGRTVVPTIAALHGHHDAAARGRARARAQACSRRARRPTQVLEALARGLTNKFLHAPLQALNAGGRSRARRADRAMFEHIYRLPTTVISDRTAGVARDLALARFDGLAAVSASHCRHDFVAPSRARLRSDEIFASHQARPARPRVSAELDAILLAPRTRRATSTAIAR